MHNANGIEIKLCIFYAAYKSKWNYPLWSFDISNNIWLHFGFLFVEIARFSSRPFIGLCISEITKSHQPKSRSYCNNFWSICYWRFNSNVFTRYFGSVYPRSVLRILVNHFILDFSTSSKIIEWWVSFS